MTAITDDKIATAIAKLHSNGAALEANLLEAVTAFLKLHEIHDDDVTAFQRAVGNVVDDINEYHRQQARWDE